MISNVFLRNFNILILFITVCFTQDVFLTLDGGNLNYESTADISGFQFNHDGCVTGASGGDAAANGFTISSSGTIVLAFSFTGATIPPGNGVLVVLDGDVSYDCLDEFIFSDPSGDALAVDWPGGFADDGGDDGDDDGDGGDDGGDTVVHEVEINGMAFTPSSLEISEGDVVRWINNNTIAHTSTSTSDTVWWDSGTLNTGDSFEFQFDSEGDFPYDCTFHPAMVGNITVVSDDGPPECVLDCPGFSDFSDDVEFCEWIVDTFPNDPCLDDCSDEVIDEGQDLYDDCCENTIDCAGTPSDNVLSVIGSDVNAGEATTIDIALDNPTDVVAGFEFYLTDFPNTFGSFISASGTERTSGFTISANEQDDGTYIIVGFDLSLTGIQLGEGPIVTVGYQSDGIYTAEIDINITEGSILSDGAGNALGYSTTSGTVNVSGEDPPPIFAPEDLEAVGGLTMVTLSWTHPEPWSVSSYNVYRDGSQVGSTASTNYADTGLSNVAATYCYTVTAISIEQVESTPSNESCATTSDVYLEEPSNLTAQENGLEIYLDWAPPGVGEYSMFVGGGSWESEVTWDLHYENESVATGAVGTFDLLLAPGDYIMYMYDSWGDGWNGNIFEITDSEGNVVASGTLDTGTEGMQEFTLGGGQRDLLGYEVFRDNQILDFTTATNYLDTADLEYLTEYCYNVTAVYDEGNSAFSNEACDSPQLNGPTDLSAEGTGSFITIAWNAPGDQDGFNIYRDGEQHAYTADTIFEDHDTEVAVEYCYTVKAVYDGIGESPSSNESCAEWLIFPPSEVMIEDGDGYIDLSWGLPVDEGGDLVGSWDLYYDWYCSGYPGGPAPADFYEDGTGMVEGFPVIWGDCDDMNLADGLCLGVGGNFECNAYFQFEGYATYYYFTVDDDYAEGWQDDVAYNGENNIDGQTSMTRVATRNNQGQNHVAGSLSGVNPISAFPNPQITEHNSDNEQSQRDLVSFEIHRDGSLLTTVGADVFSYRDEAVVNMTEYCYTLRSVYDEGTSEFSDTVCETPNSGPPASNLVATDLGGTIGLDWTAAPSGDVLEYVIYKDDVFFVSTTETSYLDDSDIPAGVEYCYYVRASYASGETFPTNTACATYSLDPPMTVLTEPDNAAHGINVTWDSPGTEGDGDTIESPRFVTGIPFEDSGTTVGFNDDYDEGGGVFDCPYSGSLSPDVVYMWSASPGDYNLNICDSDYDTKIYVYDDQQVAVGCVDDSCNAPDGSPYRSDLNITIQSAGVYYIIIDGYGSQSGNYNFSITEGFYYPRNATPQPEKNEYNLELYSNNNSDENNFPTRELLGYRVYRDGDLLADLDIATFEYFDASTEHDVVYCYIVKAVYTDGESTPSNESCNQWILPPATEFDAVGTNGQIELAWLASDSDEVLGYSVYRDGTLLDSTTETSYNDTSADFNVEYCYHIIANYGELGDSQPSDEECTMWEILAPDDLTADGLDGYVHLEWTDPPEGGTGDCEEYDLGYGFSWCPYAGSCEGNCGSQVVSEDYLYFCYCDAACVTFGDCCDDQFDECGYYYYSNGSEPDLSDYSQEEIENRMAQAERRAAAEEEVAEDRDLIAFNIYRDGDFLTTVDAGVYEYDDHEVINLEEYCYTVSSVYEEGESPEHTDEACATPEPGVAPSSLYAYVETDLIILEWESGSDNGGGAVIDYNVYRDGSLFSTTIGTSFADDTAEHDVEYCYVVSANFPSGESLPTNESCSMWILAAPLSISATGGNGFVQVEWTEPGVNTCADEAIPSLPFNAIGSNVGMGDDWFVQGSQGADYAYFFVVSSPIVIDITLCSVNTTYDTKLEIFTADQECIETTTGYYIDDFTCEFSSLQSTLLGVSLQPGQYYIVVDGYGGGEGTYEINVTQSGLAAQDPPDIESSISYESEKSREEISYEDWTIADGSSTSSRDLLGFNLYRDGSFLISVGPDVFSYMDLDLENGTQYCYYIIASYDEGDSQPTPEVCAAPDAGPMCPPENLVTSVEDGDVFVHLDWDPPNAGCEDADDGGDDGGADGECVMGNCAVGQVEDCSGDGDCCPETWIGDGLCDGEDQQWGCDLTCCDNDGGDCYYGNSNDGDKPHLSELEDHEQPDPQLRLNGYSIYRDLELIAEIGTDQTTYDDFAIEFSTQYCYKVKAIYDDGESNPTNESCEVVIDPAIFSTLEIPSMTVQGGNDFILPILLSNQLEVAGFQFTLSDNPDLLTGLSATPTERTEGFTMSINEFNGELIVVGFSLTGAIIEVGEGPVVDLEYATDQVESDQDVILSSYDVILGDSNGEELPSFSIDGVISLTAEPPVYGCTDPEADNYNSDANADDDSCLYTQYLDIAMQPYTMNLISINVESDDMADESIFGDIDPLLISNDSGGNYVPSYGITFGDVSMEDGYKVFLNGGGGQTLSVSGYTNPTISIGLAPFQLNLISYPPEECMDTDIAFASIADQMLLTSNDQGQYYIPSYGIMTMTEVCPGEGYSLFLSSQDPIDFTYPSVGGQARSSMYSYWEEYNQNALTQSYADLVVPTGISYPIIITDINGDVSVGDELVAYADGQVVGATRIVDLMAPIVISAWGGYHEFGINLEGYKVGESIDLRLYSAKDGDEMKVEMNLDNTEYGIGIFSHGSVEVMDMLAVPEEYQLTQNYPNPFNPTTTISFSIPSEGHVQVSVYDITGRLVTNLVDGNLSKGYHDVIWDGSDMFGSNVSAGLYIYSLKAEGVSLTRKMVLMK